MDESILKSIRKLVGAGESESPFDEDLIIHINTVLMALNQMGVGKSPFLVTGEGETWSDFLGQRTDLEGVKTYVTARVRMIFDPPSSSSTTQAYNDVIKELEWRLYVANNPANTFKE